MAFGDSERHTQASQPYNPVPIEQVRVQSEHNDSSGWVADMLCDPVGENFADEAQRSSMRRVLWQSDGVADQPCIVPL